MTFAPAIMMTILERQLATANLLHQVLNDENTALARRDADALRSLSLRKDELSATLERLTQEQRLELERAGLSLSREGMDRYLARLPHPADELRRQIHTVLEECNTLNLINGQIIAAARQSAETALAILRGQAYDGTSLYDAGGTRAHASATAPPFAKA